LKLKTVDLITKVKMAQVIVVGLIINIGLWWFSIWILHNALAELRIGIQSRKWTVTQAIVTSYQVNKYTAEYGIIRYRCVILCTYEALGFLHLTINFQGKARLYPPHGCLFLDDFLTPENAEQNALRLYPIGQSVKIFYNPKNVKQATFSPGLILGHIFLINLGFSFLSVSFMLSALAISSFFGRSNEVMNTISLPIGIIIFTSTLLPMPLFAVILLRVLINQWR
jgi:hypothetical protein